METTRTQMLSKDQFLETKSQKRNIQNLECRNSVYLIHIPAQEALQAPSKYSIRVKHFIHIRLKCLWKNHKHKKNLRMSAQHLFPAADQKQMGHQETHLGCSMTMLVGKIQQKHAARIVKVVTINRNLHFLERKKSMITKTKLIILIIAIKTIKGKINMDKIIPIGIIVASYIKETIIQEVNINLPRKKRITETMLFFMKRLIQINLNSKELMKKCKKSQKIAIMVVVESSRSYKVINRFAQMLKNKFFRLRLVIVFNIQHFQQVSLTALNQEQFQQLRLNKLLVLLPIQKLKIQINVIPKTQKSKIKNYNLINSLNHNHKYLNKMILYHLES